MISTKVYSEVEAMNIDDLRELNSYVISLIKDIKSNEAFLVKRQLSVYDKVKVNADRLRGMVGQVTEIKRTRCKVKFNIGTFNVPLEMIEIVK